MLISSVKSEHCYMNYMWYIGSSDTCIFKERISFITIFTNAQARVCSLIKGTICNFIIDTYSCYFYHLQSENSEKILSVNGTF